MLVIGLTGGIGSGKSTACRQFSALGVPIIDADLVAREVVAPGEPGLKQIVMSFGVEILATDGTLDRKRLGTRVFSDEASRLKLEAILHPLIRARMREKLTTIKAPYVIMAIPLLVETGCLNSIDRVLVIDTPEEQQLARICQRDGIDITQAREILAAQCSRTDRMAAADDIIKNDCNIVTLNNQITQLHKQYLLLAKH